MRLSKIWIEHLRCLSSVHFEAGSELTLLYGENGVGKSSVLEAIFLLGRGRSFRPSQSRQLIMDGQAYCVVRALLNQDEDPAFRIAIQKTARETQLRLGQERSPRMSDLARVCPVVILEPGQQRLLEDGPNLRRRFLDWSVFHVERQYLEHWQRFSRALKQRNALLRKKQISQLSSWNEEFIQAACNVDEYRTRVFNELRPIFESLLAGFLDSALSIQADYRRGWSSKETLETVLQAQQAIDIERGFTHAGPQRADIRLRQDAHPAKESLSRGQQKVLVTALLLAQAQHFQNRTGNLPILLVDDLASELGPVARTRLFDYLSTYRGQAFLTCLEPSLLPESVLNRAKMFHVKHGGELIETA